MADFGVGIYAITDRPDPEVRCDGRLLVAVRVARRLLTTNGAFTAIGDDEPYETLNLRDYLGWRPGPDDIAALNGAMTQVLGTEKRVAAVTAAATFAGGLISVSVSAELDDGPFDFRVELDALTGPRIRVIS